MIRLWVMGFTRARIMNIDNSFRCGYGNGGMHAYVCQTKFSLAARRVFFFGRGGKRLHHPDIYASPSAPKSPDRLNRSTQSGCARPTCALIPAAVNAGAHAAALVSPNPSILLFSGLVGQNGQYSTALSAKSVSERAEAVNVFGETALQRPLRWSSGEPVLHGQWAARACAARMEEREGIAVSLGCLRSRRVKVRGLVGLL